MVFEIKKFYTFLFHNNPSMPTPISLQEEIEHQENQHFMAPFHFSLEIYLPETNQNFFSGYEILVCTTCTPHINLISVLIKERCGERELAIGFHCMSELHI